MFRRHEMIPSDPMGRRVHLWRYGSWGAPLLVFPTAAGFAHEWEAQGMLEAIGDLIEGGRLKVYCTESNVAEAWTREGDPAWKISRHLLFERFLLEELVPFIHHDCGGPLPLAVAGCSLGAFYAANVALKHPTVFGQAFCMSGRYDMSPFLDGFSGPDLYFNNPIAFAANLGGEALERVRQHTHLTLVCGQGAYEEGCIEETHQLADILEGKGIPHRRDIWGRDVRHDWDWWKRQLRYHLVQAYG